MPKARELLDQLKTQRKPALSPLEQSTYDALGADPDANRNVLLPVAKQPDGGIEFAYPDIMLQVAKSLRLPGHVAEGGEYSQGDVTEMALDIGVGGALRGASPKIKAARDALRASKAARKAKKAIPAMTRAERKVQNALRKDFPDDDAFLQAIRRSQTSKGEPLVMQAGESAANMAETAAQFPSGNLFTRNAMNDLLAEAPAQFEAGLRKTISPEFSVRDATAMLAKQAEETASPLYKKAFQANKTMASDRLSRILRTPALSKAVKDVAEDTQNRMQLMGKPDAELDALARDIGAMESGSAAKGFNLRTLNAIKIKLDKKINSALRSTNAADRDSADALIQAKNALVDEIDALDATSPRGKPGVYAKARKTRSDIYQIEEALEDGMSFYTTRGKKALTTEDLMSQFAEYTPQQKKAYKIGLMQETIARVRNNREGANPTSFLSTPAIKGRMKAVLGKDYEPFMKTVDRTSKLYEIRNQALGGSQTSPRSQAIRDFGADFAGEIAENAGESLGFGPKTMALRYLAKKGKQLFHKMNDKTAGEVAEALFTADPKARFAFAKKMQNVINSQKASAAAKETAKQKLEAFFAMDDALMKSPKAGPLLTTERTEPQFNESQEGAPTARDLLDQLRNSTATELESSESDEVSPGGSAGNDMLQQSNPYDENYQPNPRALSGEVEAGDQALAMYSDDELAQMQQPEQRSIPQSLKQNEGKRLGAYVDTTGNRTVGYGFNMDSGIAKRVWEKAGVSSKFDEVYNGRDAITDAEAEALGLATYEVAIDDAKSLYPDFEDYSPRRQEALLDLSYQLGGNTLRDFKKANTAIRAGRWTEAARELLKSKYAKQTPNRARRIARDLING